MSDTEAGDDLLAPGRLPAGRWRGVHATALGSETMDLRLVVRQGAIDGEGIDPQGAFRLRGTFDPVNRDCAWWKTYPDGHTVEYRGRFDGEVIQGTWTVKGQDGGSFRAWWTGAQAEGATQDWEGFRTDKPGGRPRPIALALAFSAGRIEGEGTDPLGPSVIAGNFTEGSDHFTWTQSYLGRHEAAYQGVRDDEVLWGRWNAGRKRGEFGAWRVPPSGPRGLFEIVERGVGSWMEHHHHRREWRILQSHAARLGGRIMERCLWWDAGGVQVRVSCEGGPEDRTTTAHLFTFTAARSLRIVPRSFLSRLRGLFGGQDLGLGRLSFDQRFVVQGEPVAGIARTLTPQARDTIRDLADLGRGDDDRDTLWLEAGPTGVTIRIGRDLPDVPDGLGRFLRLATDLGAAIRTDAVEVVRVVAAGDDACQGVCPVCGEPLGEPLTRCEECRTPHHADCWEYAGECAVFGCAAARRGKPEGAPPGP